MGVQAAEVLEETSRPKTRRKKSKKPTKKQRDNLILDTREEGLRLAWKMLKQWRVRLNYDEVVSIVGVALCEAASRFDYSYGTAFRTFFYYHLRGLLLKEISSRINSGKVMQLVPTISSGEDTHLFFSQDWPSQLVDKKTPEKLVASQERYDLTKEAYESLDELEQVIIRRVFVDDESLTSIADDLGYCRCHLSRVKTKALKTLAEILTPVAADGEVKPLTTTSEAAKAAARKKNYTGGRGRRRSTKKSSNLKKKVV